MNSEILPVVLGADMNCYSVARAFHEAYGVTTHAFGRYAMGETKYTRIVNFTAVPDLDKDSVLLSLLASFAVQYPHKTKILLGCTDDYAQMIIRNRDALSKNYIVPYINEPLMESLVSKEEFYKHCDAFDIPYPATFIMRQDTPLEQLASLPFEYPVVIKPSSSIEYWKFPFKDMKKVYLARNEEEARIITNRIYESGYSDSLIIQDMIPGADCQMHVLTAYSDRNSKVKMACLGNVLLEEHTPKALGNHAAILTEYNPELMEKLTSFLDSIQYTGFSNFDIKYDSRDGQYKVFEINLRQGRSNYYVTGAGINLARLLVEDHVQEQDLGDPLFYQGESFWHSIPAKIVWEYTADPELVRKAKAIVKQKKDTTTLGYKFDLRWNPMRWFYIREHYRRYYQKYATYCKKPNT